MRKADAGYSLTAVESPQVFRGLLPTVVSLAQMDPREADPAGIDPFERLQITRAVDSRRREFAAGRLLARSLLRARGLADCSLLNGSDRAPVWPPSIVGSITHCATLCVVAIAPASELFGLGIDIEHAQALPAEITARVVSQAERQSIARLPRATRDLAARLVFSAKEATYKALYPSIKRFLDFHELHVELDDAGHFSVTGTGAISFATGPIRGRYRIEGCYIATAVVLEAASHSSETVVEPG
jgi:4'-phosphopantetheinyl transferase EntD